MPASSSLTTHTNSGLVALSIAIAIVASYLALDLTRRSADASGWHKWVWITGAGITMGAGIWSMHFIGMLALDMSMPVTYDDTFAALSLLAAVVGASVSLAMVTRRHLSRRGLLSAAAFMGLAVAAMHYLGMAGMQMPGAIHWHVGLVILSVVIGLVSSLVALSLLVRIRQSSDGFGFARRAGAAVLLGIGAAGLHYTGMRASSFTVAARTNSVGHGFTTDSLVVLLAVATGVMLAVLVVGAAIDQRRAALASDLTIVANIARDLCRVGDSRTRVCEAVAQLTGADFVSLLEPDEHGTHQISAGTGLPPDRHSVGAGAPHRGGTAAGAETLAEMIELSDGESTVHCENLTLDGRHVGLLAVGWNTDRVRRLSDRTRTLLGMVAAEAAVAIDRESLMRRLEYLSRRDELTGLLNRRVLNEELERELTIAHRHNRPLSVIMLDLDHFKDYNDTHGHQSGDRLLKSAAAAWLTELRSTDLIARYGGEEFVVILPDCDIASAVVIADRLREAVPDGATCSAGVSALKRFDTASRVIERADRALYEAKACGRDQTQAPAAHSSTQDVIG